VTTRAKRWVIGLGEVTLDNMANLSVGSSQIVDAALISRHYSGNSIPEPAYGNETVSSRALAPLSVSAAKLGDAAVVERTYGASSIPTSAYKTNTIPSAAYGDLTITNGKIANATIDVGAKAVAGSISTGAYGTASVTPEKLSFGPIAQGPHTIWVPSKAITPSDTSGATPGLWKSAVNPNDKPSIYYLSFSAATPLSCDFSIGMPKSWNAGSLEFYFHWMHPTTTVDFGVRWQVRTLSISPSDVVDTTFGSWSAVTSTGGSADREFKSSAVTSAPSGAVAGDRVYVQVERDTTHAADTLAVAAYLTGITVIYNVDKINDA